MALSRFQSWTSASETHEALEQHGYILTFSDDPRSPHNWIYFGHQISISNISRVMFQPLPTTVTDLSETIVNHYVRFLLNIINTFPLRLISWRLITLLRSASQFYPLLSYSRYSLRWARIYLYIKTRWTMRSTDLFTEIESPFWIYFDSDYDVVFDRTQLSNIYIYIKFSPYLLKHMIWSGIWEKKENHSDVIMHNFTIFKLSVLW